MSPDKAPPAFRMFKHARALAFFDGAAPVTPLQDLVVDGLEL